MVIYNNLLDILNFTMLLGFLCYPMLKGFHNRQKKNMVFKSNDVYVIGTPFTFSINIHHNILITKL